MSKPYFIEDALMHLGNASPIAIDTIRQHLTENNQLHPLEASAPQPLVCVDGAAATTQTELVNWHAVVATNSATPATLSHLIAAPVNPFSEHLRSAIMATCEMAMANAVATDNHHVWMDGGLSTPLVSVATALAAATGSDLELLVRHLNRLNVTEAIVGYVDLAASGRLFALPKQDTASGYVDAWSTISTLSAAEQEWVASRKDAQLLRQLIPRGHYIAPRRAVEALRAKIRVDDASGEDGGLSGRLGRLYAVWRGTVNAGITYAMPPAGSGKLVKIEVTAPAGQDLGPVAASACKIACSHIAGARIIEPLPQHLVDKAAKQNVTSEMISLMAEASHHLGDRHPEAVRRYRS